MTDCMLEYGLFAHAMDVRYSRHHDLSTSTGLLSTFQAIRRVIAGGFLWLGIPCSSFIWLSRGSTFRSSLRPRGKKRLRKVRETNRMVRRLLYVMEYAHTKGIEWCIEQPSSSLLPLYRPFEEMIRRHKANFFFLPLGMHGHSSEKRTVLISTAKWMDNLPCPSMTAERRRLLFKIQRMKQIKMVRKYRDGTGRARVVGSRSLTASQTYPWQFCYTVSGLFSKNMKTLKEETILSDPCRACNR